MLFPVVLFAFYFIVGGALVFALWAIKIRFGDSTDLDPDSLLVRIFKKSQPSGEKGHSGLLSRKDKPIPSTAQLILKMNVDVAKSLEVQIEEYEKIQRKIKEDLGMGFEVLGKYPGTQLLPRFVEEPGTTEAGESKNPPRRKKPSLEDIEIPSEFFVN